MIKKKSSKKTTKKKVTKKSTKKASKKTTKKKTAKKTTKKASKKTAKKKVKKQTSKKTTTKKTTKKASKKIIKPSLKTIPEKQSAPIPLKSLEKSLLEKLYEDIKKIDFFIPEDDECLEKKCENPATSWGHCRLHYMKNWHDIKKKQEILKSGKLQSCIKGLEKYPVEDILNDLKSDKSFFNTLKALNLKLDEFSDSSPEDESEDDQDISSYETKISPKSSFDDLQ